MINQKMEGVVKKENCNQRKQNHVKSNSVETLTARPGTNEHCMTKEDITTIHRSVQKLKVYTVKSHTDEKRGARKHSSSLPFSCFIYFKV